MHFSEQCKNEQRKQAVCKTRIYSWVKDSPNKMVSGDSKKPIFPFKTIFMAKNGEEMG